MPPKSSRFRGVTLFRPTKKWRAQISAAGKTTSLGCVYAGHAVLSPTPSTRRVPASLPGRFASDFALLGVCNCFINPRLSVDIGKAVRCRVD